MSAEPIESALQIARLWLQDRRLGDPSVPPGDLAHAVEGLCDFVQATLITCAQDEARPVPDPHEPLHARIDTLRGAMVAAFDVLRKRVDSLHGGHESNKELIQDLQRRVTLLGTVAEKCERALLERINAEHGLLQDLQQRVSWLEHPER